MIATMENGGGLIEAEAKTTPDTCPWKPGWCPQCPMKDCPIKFKAVQNED